MSKKKRRHRLGSQSSQKVALGRRELIVRTLAQEPHAHLRLNAAGVEKMSEVLLGFAEPILDELNQVVDFRAAFSGSYLRFYAKYACPSSHALSPFFEHPFARLGCFGRDRWNLWARRHNDQWICIERRFQTLRECFQSMRENSWFHF